MRTVDEATRIVLENVEVLGPPKNVAIEDALGLCLAQDVSSDIDVPPFDKAAMDGYALISSDTIEAPLELVVVENIAAGQMPTTAIETDDASKIMTGAIIPEGADAVVKLEDTSAIEDGRGVQIHNPVAPGLNISKRGEDIKEGQTVLTVGTELRPQEIGILAAIGKQEASVFPTPRIGVISTGSELVEANVKPGPGQIRDTNRYSIMAQARQLHAEVESFGIVTDERESITEAFNRGLEKDILILSGGVSMGEYDLVGKVIRELGVELLFQKVFLRPGKPTLFGKKDDTVIFALPGNPVATLVTFILFVAPAVRKMMGFREPGNRSIKVPVSTEIIKDKRRSEYRPAQLGFGEDGKSVVSPVEWHGSGDLFATTKANCLIVIPDEVFGYEQGEEAEVLYF